MSNVVTTPITRRWFACEPADEAFLSSAPVRIEQAWLIDRPAAEVWADLVEEHPLGYVKAIAGVTWTSPRPFGVGTTRQVRTIGNSVVLDEEYFIWEEGRRKAFYAVRASAPGFKRFAEDYVVEPVTDTTCRYTWTVAIESTPLFRPGAAVNKLLFKAMFADVRRHYAAHPVSA